MRTEASQGQSKQATSAADGVEAGILRASQADASQAAQDDATLLALDTASVAPTLQSAHAPARSTPIPGRSRNWLGNAMQSFSLDERLGRIILSIILAALLWFYVVSLENPAQVTQFNGTTLNVRGLDSGLKVINTLPGINVTVQAPQNIMSNLRAADVRPYVNINSLGAGVHEVPVSVDVNGLSDEGLLNFTVSPRTVQVQLEVQATRVYSVSVRVIGAPAFGYGVEPAQLDPSQVSVSGSENAVNRVSQVLVTVDVDEKAGTQRGYKNPVALDSAGQEITGLTFQPSTVQVVVPVKLLLNYKLVPVHVSVVGNPAPGYSAYEIKRDPTNITICCAPSDILEPVLQLETEPVSIAGATSTVLTTTRLILPAGVELYPGQSREISVTVTISTFETTWQLSVAPTVENLAPNVTSVLSPNNIELTLSGTLAQFQSLKPTDVSASVNAENLGPGTYELEPQVIVPQGVRLVSVTPDKLLLTIIPPTPVPPTLTPIPTVEPTTEPTTEPTPLPTATINAVTEPTQTVAVAASTTRTSAPTATAQPTSLPATPTHTITPSPIVMATATYTPNPTATPITIPTATTGNIAEQIPTPQPPRTPTPTPGAVPPANPIDPGP